MWRFEDLCETLAVLLIYIYVFIEVIADLSVVQDIKYTTKHNTYKIYSKTYTCTSNTSLFMEK